jgi:Histidine kinase
VPTPDRDQVVCTWATRSGPASCESGSVIGATHWVSVCMACPGAPLPVDVRVAEWRADAVVAEPEHHPLLRVRQVVAVVHPDPRVGGFERHLPHLPRADIERVHPQWTAGRGLPVPGQDQHGVAVQMPGVGLETPVDHGELDQIAFCDELIGDGRMPPAVDRVRVRRSSVDHGHTAVEDDREVPIDLAGIERHSGLTAVVEKVELRPSGGVLNGRVISGVITRVQTHSAVAIVVEHECHGLRIAREVHDTVAHAIAIINVQSGVTAHVLDKRPERARETLVAIEQTSSQALQEMRTILGVLRDGDDGRVPHPGLGQIDELVATARDAGLDVKLEGMSPAAPLPSAVGSAVYRILQESITNVIRHVGPTRVTARIDYGVDLLEIRVTDEGRRDDTRSDGSTDQHRRAGRPAGGGGSMRPGRGILGMRERCELLGGELDARPIPGGGFEVAARLPLAAHRTAHA